MKEQTYIMVKPHFANYEKVVKEVKKRMLGLGLSIIKEGYIKYGKEESAQHYAEHISKPFYPELETYITSEKAYGIILEGEDAISKARSISGPTIKKDKITGEQILPPEGTIRRDIPAMLGEKCRLTENVLHTSDNEISAKKEIAIFKNLLIKSNEKRKIYEPDN